MRCLSTISFSIFINGKPKGKFRGSRGLKQRDPLSPFLFTLVVDALGRLIDKATQCKAIRGFTVGKDQVEVSHLQFADDTLLFMEADCNFFLNYLAILQVFGSILGLPDNLRKSIILGINTEDDLLHNMATLSGCEVEV